MSKPITEETISHITGKVDIVDIIGEYVHLKKSGRNYLGLCPFHNEKTPSFSVSHEKQFYHCFGCGAGGNVFSFLMEMEGYTFPQAVRSLGEKTGVSVHLDPNQEGRLKQRNIEKENMQKAHHLAAQLFHHMLMERKEGAPARKYLQDRGFKLETLTEFEIGFAPDSWDFLTNFLDKRQYPLDLMEKAGLLAKGDGHRYFDRFRNRVMFPIKDAQGQVIAFGGRTLGEDQPKYLNSPETPLFHKSQLLFNFHRARPDIRQNQTTILYEGFIDVISSWQAGVTNATAPLGTSISEDQARVIKRNSEKVILCFDGDQAGINAMTRAHDVLEKQGCLIKVAALPDGVDPDDYIQSHGAVTFQKNVLQQAKSHTAFRLDALRKGRNLQDDEERMAYVQEALDLISRLNRAVERDHYLRQIAQEFSLSLDALKQEQYQIFRTQKSKENRDKASDKWNNSRNNGKHLVAKQMFPAYHNAERHLLAHMLQSAEVAHNVREEVGSDFNIDEHSALAAYLYAFYAEGHEPDIQMFLSKLEDPELIQLATQLSILSIEPDPSDQVIRDYIKEILTYPFHLRLKEKEDFKRRLERQGDILQAAYVAKEIMEMQARMKQDKNSSHVSFIDR
ncbi:DNA primase [Caldalkalibacillus salinus]|uniref:DNA primase n=1 Tax=Caldalkalibacillus salinus TaxID=2803787 RepID=UPI001920CA97|nr:DNA primase [Caldalkalibacillus salinus]